MRILVRANAHRPWVADGDQVGIEIASSPDTPTRPDRWVWSIRLLDQVASKDSAADLPPDGDRPHIIRHDLEEPDGSGTLEVAADPDVVLPEVEVVRFSEAGVVKRDPNDLVALLVTQGSARVEDRHLLRRLDALMLEGDDPLRVGIVPAGEPTSVAVVRLRTTQTATVNWVP